MQHHLVMRWAVQRRLCVSGQAESGHGHFSATGWERGPFWLEP